jgi:hypothetical protein
LKTLQERAKELITLALDGFEVLGFRRFVRKGLKIRDKPVAKVGLVVDAMAWKMSEPSQRVLPRDNGQVRHHDVFCRSGGLGGGCIDGQPTVRILLRLVLVDVGDLEVRRPLDRPEPGGKG